MFQAIWQHVSLTILPAALLTQPLIEMRTRNTSLGGGEERGAVGGKGGRCVGLTTLPPQCANCLVIWEPQLPGTLVLKRWVGSFGKGGGVYFDGL